MARRSIRTGKNPVGEIGFLLVAGLVLIMLKLTERIGWSWWWVPLRFYGLFILAVIVGATYLAMIRQWQSDSDTPLDSKD